MVQNRESFIRFRRRVLDYYKHHGRNLPWRAAASPYHIVVSEVMLQQTQVSRVIDKYCFFIKQFPTIVCLAQAPAAQVLSVWQGLGYNRRALYLKQLAERVVHDYGGMIPDKRHLLRSLPAIGEATAGSICAFAFNQPEVFIETNIRSVFLHYFFPARKTVSDREILPLVEKTMDRKNPRRWYSALMDYGVYLKETVPNPSRRSSGYYRQGAFEGSRRQLRGRVLKAVLGAGRISLARLSKAIAVDRRLLDDIVAALCRDGLLKRKDTTVYL